MTISLNTAHPAYPFIQHVWPFKEAIGMPKDLISGAPVTDDAGGFTWTLESSGYGITLTTTDIIGIGTDPFPTAPNITILFRRRKTDATNRFKCAFGYAGDTSGVEYRCTAFMPINDGRIIFDFGGNTTDVSRLIIADPGWGTTLDTFVIRVNASEIRIWRNGSDLGHTTGGAPPTRLANGTHGQINNGGNDAGGDNQFIDLFAIYSGNDLTDAMCLSLSTNPLAIFAPIADSAALVLTGYPPNVRAPITPASNALAVTGVTSTVNVTLPAYPAVGTLALTGAAPTVRVTTVNVSHTWNVRAPLNSPLQHVWTVIPTGLIAPLLHLWHVRNPMIGLNHVWRVIPNVAVLGDADVQKPTQQVTKTP